MGEHIMMLYHKYVKKEWKTAFLAALILGFCVHMYKFTNTLPGNDSLYNFYHSQNIVGAGRWLLTVACGLSSFHDLPWLIGLFSMVYLGLTAVVVADHFRIKNPVLLVLCAGMITVFPSVTDTLYFEFTADGYFLAMLLSVLAARLTRMDTITPGRMIAAAVLICCACGIYQAYVSTALVLAICGFLQVLLEEQRPAKQYWKWIGCQAVIYAAALGSYYVIWQVLLKVEQVAAAEYSGISELGSFGLMTLVGGVWRMIQTLILFFFEWNVLERGFTLYGAANLILLALLAAGLVSALVKGTCRRSAQHLLLLGLGLLALPLSICIWHFASPQAAYFPRMLGSVSILFVFTLVLIERWWKPKWSDLAAAAAVVMILNNAVQANIAYYYMDRCYERTYADALEMTMRIRPLAEQSGADRIAIAGNLRTDVSMESSAEVIYFPLLSRTVMGELSYDHIHVGMFIEELIAPELEFVDQLEAHEISQSDAVAQMGIWPAGDSVAVIGDTIVIKLDVYDPAEGLSFIPR